MVVPALRASPGRRLYRLLLSTRQSYETPAVILNYKHAGLLLQKLEQVGLRPTQGVLGEREPSQTRQHRSELICAAASLVHLFQLQQKAFEVAFRIP